MDIGQYIQQRRSAGVADAQIRQELAVNGWSDAMLDQAFAAAATGTPGILPDPVSMPARAAAPSQPRRGAKRLVVAVSLLATMLVLAGAAVWLAPRLTRHASKAADTLARPALKANQAATARRADILSLVGKLSDYMTANAGTMPGAIRVKDAHTLLLCSTTCDSAPATEATFGFDISGVELHPYAADLQVPNGQAIYVVPGAACNEAKSGIRQSSSRGFAVLYSVAGGNTAAKQGCINN